MAQNSSVIIGAACLPSERCAQLGRVSLIERPPNTRLKLTARVDCGMNRSSARRSLSAIR